MCARAHFLQSLNSFFLQDVATVAVVGRGPIDRAAIGTLDLAGEAVRDDKNPWLTQTESCKSDETEEEPLRAPPGLLGLMKEGLDALLQDCKGCRAAVSRLPGFGSAHPLSQKRF